VASIARPEAGTDALMRIGFCLDAVGAGARRGSAAVETCHRHVERSPEEVHRTDLAVKVSREAFEDSMGNAQGMPEAPRSTGIVAPVHRVLLEADRVRHFDRHGIDMDGDAHL